MRSRALDWAKNIKTGVVKPLWTEDDQSSYCWPVAPLVEDKPPTDDWATASLTDGSVQRAPIWAAEVMPELPPCKCFVPHRGSVWTVNTPSHPSLLIMLFIYFIKFELLYDFTDCSMKPSVVAVWHLECVFIIGKRLFSVCKTYSIQKIYTKTTIKHASALTPEAVTYITFEVWWCLVAVLWGAPYHYLWTKTFTVSSLICFWLTLHRNF